MKKKSAIAMGKAMESQKQDTIYNNLVKYWRRSYKSSNLTKIPKFSKFISEIRALVSFIKHQIVENQDPLVMNVFEKTIQNINFMLDDLFQTRLEKILTLARDHMKIDEKLLLPAEIDFYRGVYTAFKGFNTSKKMIFDEIALNKKEKGNSNQKTKISHKSLTQNVENTDDVNEAEYIDEIIQSDESDRRDELEYGNESDVIEKYDENESVDQQFGVNPDEQDMEMELKSSENISENLSYIPIRFLTDVFSLVGADLMIYGPFSNEDIAYMPKQNAEILIEENSAKKIAF